MPMARAIAIQRPLLPFAQVDSIGVKASLLCIRASGYVVCLQQDEDGAPAKPAPVKLQRVAPPEVNS